MLAVLDVVLIIIIIIVVVDGDAAFGIDLLVGQFGNTE